MSPVAGHSEALRARVQALGWWHRIDLGNGLVTPGRDDTARKLKLIRMPERLDGKSVLDIGAWDGFYAFEAERRGAARVLAIDWDSWGHGGWGSKEGFDLAHEALNSRVESRVMDAMELSPERVGMFDLVLYLGVLYHVRHPLLALEKVFSVTREQLVLETHAVFGYRKPVLEFYPGTELLGDATNWFVPNPAAVEGLLRAAGFRRIVPVLRPTSLAYRLGRSVRAALRGAKDRLPLSHGRLVYHAWR
ncbi:MAG TPA: DUF1698 domain-containing protein [Candidatus Eisenbacteria bacterium]|nr:DUF1698 domain-containing protein [Candidatus Eisenbacteria bacterium]